MPEFLIENSEPGRTALKISRIILFAMIMGVVAFLGVVLFITRGQAAPQPAVPLISYMAGGFAALNLILSTAIPSMSLTMLRKQMATQPTLIPEELLPGYQTQLIVGGALLEGAALFNIVAYLMEQQWFSLGAVGILLLAMAQKFPTAGRLEGWIRTQMELIELQRGQN